MEFALLQNQKYMAFIVLNVLWENEDVIDVTNHKSIQLFMKDIVHRTLENNKRIWEGDEWKMVFKTYYNHFEYVVMSFGLTCLFHVD
jgi:hypothetical protein